jgi:hypothetical protein
VREQHIQEVDMKYTWDYPTKGLRYPRTLEEAFGPYARGGLVSEPDPMTKEDRAIAGIAAVVLVVVALLAVVL